MGRPDLGRMPARRHRSGSRRLADIMFCIVALLVVGSAAVRIGQSAGAAVHLKAREFFYEPKELTAPSGEVMFSVKNEGAIEHNFVLEDSARKKVAEIPIIDPGITAEAKAVVKPGKYTILCTLPGHAQAGMVATLSVP